MILHLVAEATWSELAGADVYAPESLTTEGFVHCTGDDATLIEVANRFYRNVEGALLVLSLDESALEAETRWEPPAHPDGRVAIADEPLFPHVYGPLSLAAVRAVRLMRRADDGSFDAIVDRASPLPG